MNRILNALSVDVEDYFQVSAFSDVVPYESWEGFDRRVEANTRRLADVFEQRGVTATFFVLGWIAERHPALVRDLQKALAILRGKTSKKVKLVLLIDEVDELNVYDPKVNQKLRSLFMKSFAEDLVAVVSGVAIKKQWTSEGSPWYNFFEEIQVKPFSRTDAENLILRPIRGVFQVDHGVVDRILEVTDCKPYLIQKTCIALVHRLHEGRRRRITVADVEAVGRPAEA